MKLIVILAAAGLVLVTALAFTARLWWVFDLFTHFRLQYVVAAAVLCLLALIMRANRTAVVLLVVALLHGWAIKDLWLGSTAAMAAAGTPLRVASANVLASNPTPEKVIDFVKASGADLVILVEAGSKNWQKVLATIAEDYPYRAPDGWSKWAPIVLFSRYPILRETSVRSPQGGTPHLLAKIGLGEHTLTVVGVHPQSPSLEEARDSRRRNRQLVHIAGVVSAVEGRVIVAGDFNISPWSPHFRDLVAATSLRDAAEGHGWIATWPRWFWPAQVPIDHILVRGPVAVASIARGASTGSDHYPLVADLRLLSD
jgi:endonuclease/exonuclease/phosphatase (EEP) superfamily protein YafD